MRDHECGGIALDRRCAEPPRGMGSRNLRRIRAWSNVYVGGERARSLRLRRRHPPASRSMLANEKRRRVFCVGSFALRREDMLALCSEASL